MINAARAAHQLQLEDWVGSQAATNQTVDVTLPSRRASMFASPRSLPSSLFSTCTTHCMKARRSR